MDKGFYSHTESYSLRLNNTLSNFDWSPVEKLACDLLESWRNKKQVFICGNGGSAGNAIHLANDFIYGIAKQTGKGMRINALSSNPSIITCLANDVGYENVFAEQLAVLGNEGDILIVLSGSGNSPNILEVVRKANKSNIKSYGILGFDGGECKKLVQVAIHFKINDMQISEDLQMIVGHVLMQWLYENKNF